MQEIINSFGLDWKIFTAEIVNFIIILFILYYFLFRKVFANLEKRQEIIKKGVEKGEEAEKIVNDAEKKADDILADSRLDANDRVKESMQKAKDKEAEILKEAETLKSQILERAEKAGEKRKEDILKNIDKDIAKLAVLGAEKVLSEK
ncbi:ATP synthase F0 subunit B [Candidatus Campbellbacteria bacterium]|nr:MAG: ATP synthase F0 subunit B [Candidatus Campbellbacteria bacterium]